MKKREIDIGNIILKATLLILSVMVALAVFQPHDGKIQNFPLFGVLVGAILLYALLAICRKIILLFKVKRLFKNRGAENINISINPFFSWFHGNYGMTFILNGDIYSVLVLLRKNAWTSHHFDSLERIEYYKTTRSATRTNKVRGSVSRGELYTRCVGKRSLKWLVKGEKLPQKRMVVFNKSPMSITSSSARSVLDLNMEIFENTIVFDYNSLKKLIG